MAAFAMSGDSDAALADEMTDVSLIERLAERVAMGGLSPLNVRRHVTGGAPKGGDELRLSDESSARSAGIGRSERVGAELQLVAAGYLRK